MINSFAVNRCATHDFAGIPANALKPDAFKQAQTMAEDALNIEPSNLGK
jgi:hypothetical protein